MSLIFKSLKELYVAQKLNKLPKVEVKSAEVMTVIDLRELTESIPIGTTLTIPELMVEEYLRSDSRLEKCRDKNLNFKVSYKNVNNYWLSFSFTSGRGVKVKNYTMHVTDMYRHIRNGNMKIVNIPC